MAAPHGTTRHTSQHYGAYTSSDGKYVQFKISGHNFMVSSKYRPPILKIGEGSFGLVCSALNSVTGERVAIKKIVNAFRDIGFAKRCLRELLVLKKLRHRNIISIKDILPPPQLDQFHDVYIVTELMETDLHRLIFSSQALPHEKCQVILSQMLRGLKYIHSANVIHRDMKPDNILLNLNSSEIKICDFGMARLGLDTEITTECIASGYNSYRAPELLLHCAYGPPIDIWSVGCIFLELMIRRPLYEGSSHKGILCMFELLGSPTEANMWFLHEYGKHYIRQLPRFPPQSLQAKFPHVHPDAIDLVEKMLQFDPTKRITAEGALAHPYLVPICRTPYSNNPATLSIEYIKERIYRESAAFNTRQQ